MKMVMICYNEAMDDEVMETLEGCALQNYTKFQGVFGRGTSSGTHRGDDIWPGRNNALFVAAEDEKAARLLSCVRSLRERFRSEGIKAFVWDLTETT
jgi:nitrogen regulatory protein PII